jgi:hypothetical protein
MPSAQSNDGGGLRTSKGVMGRLEEFGQRSEPLKSFHSQRLSRTNFSANLSRMKIAPALRPARRQNGLIEPLSYDDRIARLRYAVSNYNCGVRAILGEKHAYMGFYCLHININIARGVLTGCRL